MDMHNVVYGHATNLTFGNLDSVFAGDSVLTAAMLDRVLHHSIIISINGECYRLKDKRKAGLLSAPGKAPRTNEQERASISVRCAADTETDGQHRLVLNPQSKLRSQCSFPAVGQAKRSTIASPHDPTQLKSFVGQSDTKRTRKVVPTLAPIKTAFGKWLALDQTDLNPDPPKPSRTRSGHLVAQPLVV